VNIHYFLDSFNNLFGLLFVNLTQKLWLTKLFSSSIKTLWKRNNQIRHYFLKEAKYIFFFFFCENWALYFCCVILILILLLFCFWLRPCIPNFKPNIQVGFRVRASFFCDFWSSSLTSFFVIFGKFGIELIPNKRFECTEFDNFFGQANQGGMKDKVAKLGSKGGLKQQIMANLLPWIIQNKSPRT